MRSIALRFGEHFAPECGTIIAHKRVIESKGFVWYGKLGTPISETVSNSIMKEEIPKILLIQSGKGNVYWAHIKVIQRAVPSLDCIPEYYQEKVGKFNTWFKVLSIEEAEKDILNKCIVVSSKKTLLDASKHSMSPYFIIDYLGEEG